MKGIEGVSSGAEIERKKRIESWHKILSSGELIRVQENTLASLSSEISETDSLRAEYEFYLSEQTIRAEKLEEIPEFAHPGLETRKHFYHQMASDGGKKNSLLRCYSHTEKLNSTDLKLFQTFTFLHKKTEDILAQSQIQLSPEVKDLYRMSTALATPQKIVLDNVQTYFDIMRFASQNSMESSEQIHAFRRLFEDRSDYTFRGYDLNPRKETNVELLARAPFAFWSTTRFDMPTAIDGVPVVNSDDNVPLFSNEFMELVARGNVSIVRSQEDAQETLLRHGGCPVLHRPHKDAELIARTNQVFSRFYNVLQRE